jgi:hypothetical protein
MKIDDENKPKIDIKDIIIRRRAPLSIDIPKFAIIEEIKKESEIL